MRGLVMDSGSWMPGLVVAIGWRPGVGDPTVGGWLTVALYALTALLCAAAGVRLRRRRIAGSGLWWTFGALLGLLGLNKQLDVQILVIEIGKHLAREQGWYEFRGMVRAAFVGGLALAAGLGLVGVVWLGWRGLERWAVLAWVGLAVLAAFVLLRAAGGDHVDFGSASSADVSIGHRWLEVGGVVLILLAAVGRWRSSRAPNAHRRRPDLH